MMKRAILWLVLTLFAVPSLAQTLYSDSTVLKLHLQFSQSDYWELLQQNKEAAIDLPALLIVNDDERYDSVGVRFKGNSSYNIRGDKKSFNISLDAFVEDQRLWGYKTLNLNNGFVDPTFVREKIAYDIFRKYMPAGEVGYVRLYLNGEYWGLYVNVEQVNKDFLAKWFSSKSGNLYKGDPRGALAWRNTNDPEAYKKDYEKKTNENEDDWSDLVALIDVLNNADDLESELPTLLNVDRALWYLALCNIFVNLDSYIFSGHNYYIYSNPETGRFNFIPWDLNEAFGGFPPQLTLQQKEQFPVLTEIGMPKLPLTDRLFKVPSFRAAYAAHYRTILNAEFHPDSLRPRIDYLQDLIDEFVQQDVKKLYPYEYFSRNVADAVVVEGGRTIPGILTLVENRRDFLLQHPALSASPPAIHSLRCSPETPRSGGVVDFQADLSGNDALAAVNLFYRIGKGAFSSMPLYDDGRHQDQAANDGIYGASLSVPADASGAPLDYYLFVMDDNETAAFYPQRAAFVTLSATIAASSPGDLVINEFMAANTKTIQDPQGDFDDWVEIFNRSPEMISLKGLHLTDDPAQPQKWTFPDTSIAGGGYMLVWLDNDEGDAPGLHANFKLDKSGEFIGLYDADENGGQPLDSYTFGRQTEDVSIGRFPNGEGDFMSMSVATPNSENLAATGVARAEGSSPSRVSLLRNYPNPFNQGTKIQYELSVASDVAIIIYDLFGRQVKLLPQGIKQAGLHQASWDGVNDDATPVASGVYFVKLVADGAVAHVSRMLVLK